MIKQREHITDEIMSFGLWVKQRRHTLDLTQHELAQRVGCSVELIRKIEADARRPSRQVAALLAARLDLPPAEQAIFVRCARAELSPRWLPLPAQSTPHGPPAQTDRAASPPRRPSNLPAPTTTLIERDADVAALRAMLRRPDGRLVTLTGAGGIGKTRLALQVAVELSEAFADGVYLVELAPLHDPALVALTIARALGVRGPDDKATADRLRAYLRSRDMLLLLDNFEHLIAAAPLVGELLAAAPRLKILATSRAALRLHGEHEYAVPPLALPPRRILNGNAQALEPRALAQYAAVRLFVERAQEIRADFALTRANVEAVAQICVRLDGLPLAIELAAARVKLFEPAALLARLESIGRLPTLATGPRDAPARQQTLRDTIAWSYALLNEAEQRLFRSLGVFGGCTLEAAEAVCADFGWGEIDSDNPKSKIQNILDGLAALVDQSLIRRESGTDAPPRFTMLETIREYALERLTENGEAEALRQRHAEYYLVMAEAAETHFHDQNQRVCFDRLELEHDNIRAALAWSLSTRGSVELGLRLAGALPLFWLLRGYVSEGRCWLARLLALAQESDVSASIQAKALYAAGMLATDQVDNTQALELCDKSLALFRELGDKRGMALVLGQLGSIAQEQGDYEQARGLHQESLALFRELGDTTGIADTLNQLARMAREQGDYVWATTLYEESLSLDREQGNPEGTASVLNGLGVIAWLKSDYTTARALFEQSLALWQELAHKWGIAITLDHLGVVAREQGDYSTAETLFEQSLALQREQGRTLGVALALNDLGTVARYQGDYSRAHKLLEESLSLVRALGDRTGIALILSNLGQLAHDEGDFKRATALYNQSLALYSDLKSKDGIAWCLEELASLTQAQGHLKRAVQLFGTSAALREAANAALRPTAARAIAAARTELDAETFAAAWAAGRAMPLDQAVAEALGLLNQCAG